MSDWTADEAGVSNSSAAYREIADAVADLIWASAHDLIRGNTETVARLIVAKLAHEHGLAPRETTAAGGGLSEDDIVRIMRESGAMSHLDINEEDVRDGHHRVGEVLPAMRLAYELGLTRAEQTPHRGGTVEAWLKSNREAYRTEQGANVWYAIDDLLNDLREHADTGTPLTESVQGPHPEED